MDFDPNVRKPRSELRHWSTYASTGDFYRDYHGHVPTAMLVGIDHRQRDLGLSFEEAYQLLLDHGAIIEVHSEPIPDPRTPADIAHTREEIHRKWHAASAQRGSVPLRPSRRSRPRARPEATDRPTTRSDESSEA
jgi:hypothetical protein